MRILHAPGDVGGQAYGLSRAERELGHKSDVVLFGPSVFGYGFDVQFSGSDSRPRRLAEMASFLRRAVRDYDVFHFNFGRSMVEFQVGRRVVTEVPLLKRAGKVVLVTFQGCDVRPSDRCPCRQPECDQQTPWRAANAARMLGHADRVFYLNPDLREWLPGARFLPYASVDPRAVQPAPETGHSEVVVVHAPTNRDVKGTDYVIAAVESLRADGVAVRLELLEGLKRDEVMRRCAAADVVVDQLLLGWYGGFAVEAMALGKPVLAYIRDEVPEDNPFGDDLPVVRTTPGTLREDLRALVLDAARRKRIANASRLFVERHHDPRRVAQTVLEDVALPSEGPASTLVPS